METINAAVEVVDEKYFIKIDLGGSEARIPLSDDRPNEVKAAFNKIISKLKLEEFQINLVGFGDDLFTQAANEYIGQLNREIREVRKEMKAQGLA